MVMEPAEAASLSDAERVLVEHVSRGEMLDFAGGEPIDQAAMRSWGGSSRTISAAAVRDVLRGRLASDPDPRGLRLRGARIAGRLDLADIVSSVNLGFYDCFFDEGLVARDATLPSLRLSGCLLEHTSEPAIDLERLHTTVLFLDKATITGDCETGVFNLRAARIHLLDFSGARLGNKSGPALDAAGLQVDHDAFLRGFEGDGDSEDGAVRLLGAQVGGQLDCSGARLRNRSGPALYADRLQVHHDAFMREFEADGDSEDGTVRLPGAQIGGQLDCSAARLRNESGPALYAVGVQVDQDVFLRGGFEAEGAGEDGAVRLLGAQIGGQLDCSAASLLNESGPALDADGVQVDQDVLLSDGFNAAGAVRLLGAEIGGQLDCSGARLRNESGPALDADSMQVGRTVFLNLGFKAEGAGEDGAVRLREARIGGALDCSGARLRNESGPALHAESLQVDYSVFLGNGFEAEGAGEDGAVRLFGAQIGGQLDCSAARLRNESGPALHAERLQVDSIFLRNGFNAGGAVRLLGAEIGGQLDCSGARLRNESGPALFADWMRVDHSVFLRNGFEAEGAGEDGAVRLPGSRIGGTLDCSRASLRNESGPALDADGVQVGRAVFLNLGFKAEGAGEDGAVRLREARIGGALDCSGARLRNESGPALRADSLQVDLDAFLSSGFEAVGAGGYESVDLAQARIGGTLTFKPSRLDVTSDGRTLIQIDGLTYSGIPSGATTIEWLGMLRDNTSSYAAQPYQQLAHAHQAAGHDGEYRRVVMAQRRDQISRGGLAWTERTWARLTGLTLGFGYQPWRALLALLVVAVAAVSLAVTVGGNGGLVRTEASAPPATANCPMVERVGVGLEIGLPLISTGSRERCDLTDTSSGQALNVASWGLQLLAWAFATLFIAGFTGAIRKT